MKSFFQEQGNQTGELPLCIKHLPFGKIICSGVFDILSSTLESSSSSWPHLYPLGLSRALRQARLPSAYKCISCPWTSCTTWNRGDADDESEISRMVFSFLCIWWWFCTMTGLLAVSNRIFFELLLPQLESKYKKVFSLFVLLYIGSRICISFINPKSASTAT